MKTEAVLVSDDPEEAVKVFDSAIPLLIAQVEQSVPDAVLGRPQAVSRYVTACRGIAQWLFGAVHGLLPDAVVPVADDWVLADRNLRAVSFTSDLVANWAVAAPFSDQVTRFGSGHGVALFLTDAVRRTVPGLNAFDVPGGTTGLANADLPRGAFVRFARCVWLDATEGVDPLERLMTLLDLTTTDLGRLFGVKRQAVEQWQTKGVPPVRRAKLVVLEQVADVLERYLQPERIPGIARREVDAYGGRSMLDMIAADEHEALLDQVRASFDFASTA